MFLFFLRASKSETTQAEWLEEALESAIDADVERLYIWSGINRPGQNLGITKANQQGTRAPVLAASTLEGQPPLGTNPHPHFEIVVGICHVSLGSLLDCLRFLIKGAGDDKVLEPKVYDRI